MSEHVGQLVDALLRGDRDLAYRLVEDHARTTPSTELYGTLLAPAMREVGERWSQDRISVAEEHVATGVMEELLALDYRRVFTRERASREMVLMACPEGERHELGLRMAANLVEGAGFRVAFLGADVPLRQIAADVRNLRAAVIVLVGSGDGRGEPMMEAVDRLRAAEITAPILIGGVGPAWPEGLLQRPGITAVEEIGAIVGAIEGALARP